MNRMTERLRYFGLVTIATEWLGLVVALHYLKGFNINDPISTLSVASQPLPLIFTITVILASVSFFLFGLYLKPHSRYIPVLAATASAAFLVVGLVPYTGLGGTKDTIHNLASLIAVLGYSLIIWECRKHPTRQISRASRYIFASLLVVMVGAYWNLFVTHKVVAIIQMMIVFFMQCWLLIVTWHSKLAPATD